MRLAQKSGKSMTYFMTREHDETKRKLRIINQRCVLCGHAVRTWEFVCTKCAEELETLDGINYRVTRKQERKQERNEKQ